MTAIKHEFGQMWCWLTSIPDLSFGAKALYSRIGLFQGSNEYAWPGIDRLALELGTNRRQVMRWVEELEAYGKAEFGMGLIEVKRPGFGKGSNRYRLMAEHPLIDRFSNRLAKLREGDTMSPKGDTLSPLNVTPCHLEGDTMSPEKNIEKTQVKRTQGKDSQQPAEADASADCYGPFIPKPNMFLKVPETDFTSKDQLDEEGKAALAAFAEEQAAEQVAFDAKLRAEFNAQCSPLAFTLPPGLELMPSVWMSSQELLAHMVHDPGPVGELMNKQTQEVLARLKIVAEKGSEKANAELKRQALRNQKRLEAQQRKYEDDPNAKGIEPQYQTPVKRFLALWYSEFEKKFPSVVQTKYVPGAKGFGKERGQAQDMFRRFDTEDVLRGAKYLIQNWDSIKPRFFKGAATHPTIGMLKTFDAQLIPEAKTMTAAFEAKSAYDKWNSENSNPFKMPVEIRESYEKAKKILTAIGVK